MVSPAARRLQAVLSHLQRQSGDSSTDRPCHPGGPCEAYQETPRTGQQVNSRPPALEPGPCRAGPTSDSCSDQGTPWTAQQGNPQPPMAEPCTCQAGSTSGSCSDWGSVDTGAKGKPSESLRTLPACDEGGKGNSSETRRALPVVVGGMVMDIQARPAPGGADLARGTTVPGEVQQVHGGVARNISECMARLGCPPFLISVVGDDTAGAALVGRWQSLGLHTEGIRHVAGAATPVVCAMLDQSGDMAAGVAQVSAVEEHLSASWVAQFRDCIHAAPLLILDANLGPHVLQSACTIAQESGTPVWCDPVSVPKSARLSPCLHQIHLMTPNRAELAAIASAASALPPAARPAPNGTRAASCMSLLQDPHSQPSIHCSAVTAAQHPEALSCCEVCSTPRTNVVLHNSTEHTVQHQCCRAGSMPGGGGKRPTSLAPSVVQEIKEHAALVLRRGVKHVLVTLGEQGALLASLASEAICGPVVQADPVPASLASADVSPVTWAEPLPPFPNDGPCHSCKGGPCQCPPSIIVFMHFPALPLRAKAKEGGGGGGDGGVVNTTGAGDCLLGAAAAAFCEGFEEPAAVGLGMMGARLAVESESNVPTELKELKLMLQRPR